MYTRPAFFVWSEKNVTDALDEFDRALDDLIQNLSLTAANMAGSKKFAVGERSYTKSGEKVYALVQCTPDLTSTDCSECISGLTGARNDYQQCCKRSAAVSILRPSCIFIYNLSTFYKIGAGDSSTSPPTATVLSPSPSAINNSTGGHKGNSRVKITIIVLVPTVLLIVLTFTCLHLMRKLKKKVEGEVASLGPSSLLFDLAKVRAVTNNFSNANKLGKGAFGPVYKGQLPNGQEIAIKRLASSSKQGEVQFENEIKSLAQLQHRNLVRLLGFCLDGKERLLIYEFVSNGSLDRFIFDPLKREFLNWDTRYKIIVGIAQGLLYLHEESKHQIIHRDLKAANILLDDDMNPRIADFGTARLLDIDQSQGQTKIIAGTFGYMPPEYLKYGQFSAKTDIFSFGVLILEIVTGLKNGDYRGSDHIDSLLIYAWNNWRQGKASSLIDPTISGGSTSEMMRCIHIGLLCAQENAAKRPTMASVVLMLNCVSTSLSSPSKPGFMVHCGKESNKSLEDQLDHGAKEFEQSSEHPVNFSFNDVTVSELYPRLDPVPPPFILGNGRCLGPRYFSLHSPLGLAENAAELCDPTANFSVNSAYGRNRDLLLSSLPTNASDQDGFYSGRIGDGSDAVYGLALCRADISKSSCFDCVNKSSEAMLKNCSNNQSGVDWGDWNNPQCIAHYSNRSLSGIMYTRPAFFVCAANMVGSKKFAVGERNYTRSGEKVYALVQCTPDLTPSDCSECITGLTGARNDYLQCCKRSAAVSILRPSCIFMYNLSTFYNIGAGDSPMAPPTAAAPARNNSTGGMYAYILVACRDFPVWQLE
ncbi:Non-specific serine/threonine protein kinase [Bertholletia excelsa]